MLFLKKKNKWALRKKVLNCIVLLEEYCTYKILKTNDYETKRCSWSFVHHCISYDSKLIFVKHQISRLTTLWRNISNLPYCMVLTISKLRTGSLVGRASISSMTTEVTFLLESADSAFTVLMIFPWSVRWIELKVNTHSTQVSLTLALTCSDEYHIVGFPAGSFNLRIDGDGGESIAGRKKGMQRNRKVKRNGTKISMEKHVHAWQGANRINYAHFIADRKI